jgi:hypothetical protein
MTTNTHLNDCIQSNDAAFAALFNSPHIVGPRIKPPPEKELIIERINITCDVTGIADLLRIVEDNPVAENVEYNINMKALHRISEPLRKLDAMVGMDSLKERVVDQIIYFIQDLHKNEIKGEKGAKDKSSGVFNDYMHTVIYGPPGTGKTASVNVATRLLKESTNSKIKTSFVHCMSEANTRVFLSTLLGLDPAADASCDDQVLAALHSLHFCNILSSSVRLSAKPGSSRTSSSSTSATACSRGVTISCRGYLRCLSARAVSFRS